MRLILGLERPTAGAVTVNGRDFAGIRRPLRQVGALLDARAFHPDGSARNHLRCLARSNHIPDAGSMRSWSRWGLRRSREGEQARSVSG